MHKMATPSLLYLFLMTIFSNTSMSDNHLTEKDIQIVKLAGAPLLSGMGDFQRKITTSNPYAQIYFNQGMVMAFAFNHAESVRSFKAAQTLDPECAMCFWGESLATGPNINVTSNGKVLMSTKARIDAFDSLSKAIELKYLATEWEQSYIDALAKRYSNDTTSPREPMDLAYAGAMHELVERYPEDMDAAALYAEALMNTMPWDYWAELGVAKPKTEIVILNLEKVLEKKPDHPLALHLYIHALEASNEPGRAEKAADRLLNAVPGAGHLVHMPSHIYYRVGRYQDAVNANIRAAEVDEKYIAMCNAQGFYPALYYPHNIHFLWAASTMQGQSELSFISARKLVENVNVEQVKKFPTIEFFRTIPHLTMVRFGKWNTILKEPKPENDFTFSQAIWHYARGIAFAAKNNSASASLELEKLRPLLDSSDIEFLNTRAYPASSLIKIAMRLLEGEIAYRKRDYLKASHNFSQAVSLQDSLPYTEPPFWYYPTRQSLGSALLKLGNASEAEKVFRKDLTQHPKNGWSMFGLAKSLEAQGKREEASAAMQQFDYIWQFADVDLSDPIF